MAFWAGAGGGLISAGGSLLGALLGSRSARKSEERQAKYNRQALIDQMRANEYGQNNALGSVTWRSNNPNDPFARTRHYEMSPLAMRMFNQAVARNNLTHEGSMGFHNNDARMAKQAANIAKVIELSKRLRRGR